MLRAENANLKAKLEYIGILDYPEIMDDEEEQKDEQMV